MSKSPIDLDPESDSEVESVSSATSPLKPLNARQKRFVEEYIKDWNGTQAAIRAGYSEKTAAVIAAENLIKPNISDAIKSRASRIAEQAGIDATWIREKLKENLSRSMQAEPVLDVQGKETGVYKYAGSVANRALELLGKDLGMFTDRLEVSLTPGLKQLIQDLAKLAIDCCDKDKRDTLLSSLQGLKAKYDLTV